MSKPNAQETSLKKVTRISMENSLYLLEITYHGYCNNDGVKNSTLNKAQDEWTTLLNILDQKILRNI